MFWEKKNRLKIDNKLIAHSPDGVLTLHVNTTTGKEIVTGVSRIYDAGDAYVFESTTGGGAIISKAHFIGAYRS